MDSNSVETSRIVADGAQAGAVYRPDAALDPLAAAIAEAFSAAPLSAFPIEMTRAAIAGACVLTGEPPMASLADFRIPVAGDAAVGLRLYVPVARPHAIIVWAHGGGFALGSIDESDNFSRLLAARTGCAVASVAYRLAPEHKFPTAVDDFEAAALWVAANLEQIGLDQIPIWLGGDSAGGNLATVVTRRLHAGQTARIAGNILAYPCTDGPQAASLRHFDPPFMSADDVAWFFDLYLPGPEAHSDPDFAPILAADLAVLPPTLIITAGHDIITGQARDYLACLNACGVPAREIRFPGMIHGFLTLDPFFPGSAGEAVDLIAGFVREWSG